LHDLFECSSRELSLEQRGQLADLLTEFQDVFARSEFDFGYFTVLEHRIDTGDAAPIKEGMQRTPLFFVEEEKAHLKKMLDAGVIQPSISEWTSAPVLIRKKDGNVRWCLDYRRLKNVTKKDVFPLRAMNLVLRGLTWSIVLALLDDALVLGWDFKDHLANLRAVFKRFRRFDLKFKPKKCATLFQTRVEFLSRRVSQSGDEMGTST
jgi:hypothetical protein